MFSSRFMLFPTFKKKFRVINSIQFKSIEKKNVTQELIYISMTLELIYRISPSISREIYPRTKYYTDNSSYTRVTPSGKKLYQKQVEFSKFGRNMTEQW